MFQYPCVFVPCPGDRLDLQGLATCGLADQARKIPVVFSSMYTTKLEKRGTVHVLQVGPKDGIRRNSLTKESNKRMW